MKRIYPYWLMFIVTAALLFMIATNASAYTYGLAAPIQSYEYTAVAYYLPNDSGEGSDDHVGVDTKSQLKYSDTNNACDLLAMPYSLHGKISTSGLTVSDPYYPPYLSTVTLFRDQIYFTTYNGQPAELVLNFNVDLTWKPDDLSTSWMSGELWLAARDTDDKSHIVYDYQFDDSIAGNLSVSSLSDSTYGGLVLSGSYFSFALSLWVDVNNGTADWSNSFILDPDDPYSVYQYDNGEKVELLPGQYALISRTPNFPSTIPEPATMLLLGLSLIGLAGYGGKQFFKK